MNRQDDPLLSLFHLGVSLHHLNMQSEKRLGLSLGQWCLLKKLIDMPVTTAHALSKAVGVHPSTLTQTLKRLESRGFIFITEDPKDSRKKLISITRAGKKALDRARTRDEMSDEIARIRKHIQEQFPSL